jgi:lipopolysaccharide transport system ATP-binding protein
MYLRLAFAVAAFLESEILLVDEVLAVGDAQFQKKCLGKMQDVVGQGRTVLFVSHNMAAIQSLCTRGILLRQGQVVMDGDVDDVVGEYLGYLSASAVDAFGDNPERSGNGDIRLTGARVLDEQGRPSSHLVAGRPATFEFPYVNHSHIRKGFLTVTLLNQLGIAATCIDTDMTGGVCGGFADAGVLRCHVPSLPLPCGEYRAATLIRAAMRTADLVPNALVFSVVSSVYYPSGKVPPIKDCACMIPHEWEHQVQAQETTAVS